MVRALLLVVFVARFAASGAQLSEPVEFTQMCDASAAVALDRDLFLAVNDEDNVLRTYHLGRGGKPVASFNLNSLLFGKTKSPEMDLEGAARLGRRIFLISSHGRKADGGPAPSRRQLFAVQLNVTHGRMVMKLAGKVYRDLVSDLSRDSRMARFQLAEAAKKAPKSPGALNIEALAATPEGGLLIGFRNPIPEGRALIVPLLNPNEVIDDRPAHFGDPILLDLGGLGLRDIGVTKRGYYLLAGPASDQGDCRLFTWSGGDEKPQPVTGLNLTGIRPEAICFQDVTNRSDFLILSDDGTREIQGENCKDLPKSQRRFRAFRATP